MISDLFAEMLECMGHCVCAIATTEDDAVLAAGQHELDLMIVDARLREGSGVVALDRISRHKSIRHMFVSGDAASLRAAKPHAVILQKPFREADLALGIERTMQAPQPELTL